MTEYYLIKRMPSALHKRIKELAAEQGTSIKAWIIGACWARLEGSLTPSASKVEPGFCLGEIHRALEDLERVTKFDDFDPMREEIMRITGIIRVYSDELAERG